MSSLALELQLVFGSACAALQAGEGQEALDNYFLARSRVRFVLEGILGDGTPTDDPAVAVVVSACRQVECTFSWALDRLTQPGGSSSLSADGTQQDSLHPESCRAVGAGLLEAWPGLGPRPDAGAGGADERGLQDVIQRCLREVSGSLDDVVGLAALKQELREAVLLPLHLPHLFTGIRRPQSNVLFHGRPGTGKTLLVEKAAAEAGLPLLALSPSAVLSKWAGESEKTLRGVFEAAAAAAPAIIFIDEIDALAPARSSGDDLSARRMLTELLLCMTALASRPRCLVFVMACTNRMEDCDPALLRRFERKIEVPAPDVAARAAFFETTQRRPEIASQLGAGEVQHLVELTAGMTGSDLAVVCRDAAMAPLRELLAALQGGQLAVGDLACAAVRPVSFCDFVAAVHRTGGQSPTESEQ